MNFLQNLFPHSNLSDRFFIMAGPCVVESREIVFEIAQSLSDTCTELQIPWILKASFEKANRSSVDSFTGIGKEKALSILAEAGRAFNVPVVTDIHTEADAALAAQYADVLQIPAFLCRQTSLLVAAAQTGKIVNIKKGQFLSPEAMQFAMGKVQRCGNESIMLTERGTTFGYQDLIVDFRGIPVMKQFGKPVVMDCTHALQQPNQPAGVTGGRPELIETIAKCAIAAGADGLFIETHPRPSEALSDGANMLLLNDLKPLLKKLLKLRQALD
ncbi:MAG: 3-deoxy-8-phosphooctulonate synthase [Chitinophagaceae bacterium]|nr:3-deoxy-8-phosphooctulonate synthase [Chitinophagaceae bacterium]